MYFLKNKEINKWNLFFAMFRFRDILVRIRNLESVHLITDPDPALYVSDLNMPTKISFFSNLFCLLLSVGTLTSVFKDKKSLKIH